MDLKLHANATTTPRIRAYIQKSSASIAALARELGIHNRTVARWKAHTILTDNGSEFTDRFAVDKKGKPPDKPSGQHPFDRLCARHAITHRLTRPFRPQTNGMVERFNRRLGDHLDRMPQNRAAHHRRFLDHAERDAYLHTFVADYNRTRLHCLDYHAPAELLAKLTGHNTEAGGAGWHDSQALAIPDNITLLALPPYSPELNPVERIWHYLRSHWLNSLFRSPADIMDACETAWNRFAGDPGLVRSLCAVAWAPG